MEDIRRGESAAWGGAFVVGLLLVLTGVACVVAAFAAGMATVVAFGVFLVIAGIVELVSGARTSERNTHPWVLL